MCAEANTRKEALTDSYCCSNREAQRQDVRPQALGMTKYCDSCHTANKDRAKYCCCCKGRFSGVRFSAHLSASTLPDSLPTQGKTQPSSATPRRGRSSSAPMRAGMLLIFLVLLLGPFAYWNSSRSPERRPLVKSSITPPDAIAAPGRGAAVPGEMECTDVRRALSLCPKK